MPDGTVQSRRSTWDEHSYAIAGEDRVYEFEDNIPTILGGALPVAKAIKLEVGTHIKYAIEKESIYVIVEGRERKFHISRTALREIPAP
jgi:hypothetical protein